MSHSSMQRSITQLPGVGPKRAAAFGKLGIFTLEDLLHHYPRGYENRKTCKKIIELIHDETVCIKAVVTSSLQTKILRKNMQIQTLKVSDGTGFLELVWFNNRFLESKLKKGDTFIFYGKVRLMPKRQMLTPIFERPDQQKQTGRIVPLYPLTEGLTENIVSDCVTHALALCPLQSETLPASVRRAYHLCDINYAIENIHFPADKNAYEAARKRLAFEELFVFQSALFSIKSRQCSHRALPLSASYAPFIASLPYTPTGAQSRVIEEIAADMAGGCAMNRLVCGDVGSGKTMVAAAALYIAAKSGFQGAFMAPTEILAAQHYESLKKLFAPHGIEVVLLTGSMPAMERRRSLSALEKGIAQVVVGTHALLSANVTFCRLGLAITDEQHRFGVNQRQILSDKGENPHILVMSATPIPRTLAMIIYGDLDVSIIDELPPGRQKIDTFALGENYRERVFGFLKKEIDAGRQTYIVCPLVEESELDELHSVTEYTAKLKEEVFPDVNIGMIHGKMKPNEKDAVMSAFKSGDIKILVATSVIEVGVDVPNATIMFIENAERFGLSQLHQLRGRVGRGTKKSYCILLAQGSSETAYTRLQVMKNNHDGFAIAEADLKQRGPGEFFGTRQHGLQPFKVANLYSDMELLTLSSQAAHDYIEGKMTTTPQEKEAINQKIEALFNNRVTIT